MKQIVLMYTSPCALRTTVSDSIKVTNNELIFDLWLLPENNSRVSRATWWCDHFALSVAVLLSTTEDYE